jgi:hypothetical protein
MATYDNRAKKGKNAGFVEITYDAAGGIVRIHAQGRGARQILNKPMSEKDGIAFIQRVLMG